VQKAVEAGEWRADTRSSEWVGFAVATALDLDAETSRKRISKLLKEWVTNDALVIVEKPDSNRMMRKFVEVGKWATE
jgi:hypothetical protein